MTPKTTQYIKSALRKIWRWTAARRECLKSKVCASCKRVYKKGELYADHVVPVVDPQKGFTTWDDYINRLFDGALQALCKKCHDVKTAAERKERVAAKKRRKAGAV